MSKNSMLKIAKSYQHYRDIVKTPSEQTVFDDILNTHATHLMNILYFASD